MAKSVKPKAKSVVIIDPSTFKKSPVNWIPVANPPQVEGRYLVWIRQGGSILNGRIGTFWYYPNAGIWEITIKFEEGEQLDMWADVLGPFWYVNETPPPTNLDRKD